jgi:uncharacterized protein YneF (UPF0154 family)
MDNQPYGNQPAQNPQYSNQPPNQPQQNIPNKETSIIAILSLIFSILGIIVFLWGLFSIVGIVLAIIAMKKIQRNPNISGKGLAKAGLIVGIAGIVIRVLLIFLLGMFLFSTNKVFQNTKENLEGISADIQRQITEECCNECVDNSIMQSITNKENLCKDLDISKACVDFFTDIDSYSINECYIYLGRSS